MSERQEFINWAQSVLVDAEIAIHNGDAAPRRAIWSRNDPVTVLGAWKNATGQRELDELFDHLADSFSDCTSYEFELLEAEVLGDVAYTVGFEHTSASAKVWWIS
jgi:ketosteroid isomerase-like protein